MTRTTGSVAPDLVVLRYGELFLKGANRSRFEQRLLDNTRRALGDLPNPRLERGQGRLFVHCEPELVPAALERLSRVFGFSSLSPAVGVARDVEAMGATALALTRERIAVEPPRTFRVSARRSDKSFPLGSVELNEVIGARIVEATGLRVDLSAPELEVAVEVNPVRSFVFVERVRGAGGLPVGASGTVALLLSGGIDSPVAGHLMQKRGCVIHPVYFHSFPYIGARSQEKVERLAARLAPAQPSLALSVVPFTDVQIAIRDGCPRDLAVVLYRRMMMRIASRIARRIGAPALATGESLGQVASQTLENIACIEAAAELPILRPLLAYDKQETIALARRIGTYDLSIEPYEDCCSLFVPRHPVTRCKIGAAERAERSLDVDALAEQAVAGTLELPIAGPGGAAARRTGAVESDRSRRS